MRILLVTGQLAKETVREYSKDFDNVSVMDLPIAVASLMKPSYIIRQLKSREIKGYDVILTSGLIEGDLKEVEKELGIKTYKGSKHASDIPLLLQYLEKIELSSKIAADELIKEELKRRALEEIEEVERKSEELVKKEGNFKIEGLALGKDFPIRIMAEIVDAPKLTDEELKRRALYYYNSGARIIDIGMIANEERINDAYRCVKAVKQVIDCPISIDSMNPEEIKKGIEAGASIVLSLDGGNAEKLSSLADRAWFVVIPTNFDKNYFPKGLEERVKALEDNVRLAKSLGFKKILADLILDPFFSPNFTESLISYHLFSKRNPNIPLLMGVGNLTELTDTDTLGMNVILAGSATELNISIILTTEVSDRNKGSVRELCQASRMMFLAKKRRTTPKGLGIDMIFIKDKKLKDESYPRKLEKEIEVIHTNGKEEYYKADPKGCFRFYVDREKEEIIAIHYPTYKLDKPALIIKGKRALDIYREIVKRNLVSTLDHSAYLGAELQKAEISLKLGKSYIQDSPLF
ncbi:MAG: dihydropteroate synthase-like protein [Nitrososphaerales archaeon]